MELSIIFWEAFWSQEVNVFGGTNEIFENFKAPT